MKFIITLEDRSQIVVDAQYPIYWTNEVMHVDRETREKITFLNLYNEGAQVAKVRADRISSIDTA